MNLIDPNQISDVQSLRNIAATYKLAHESANTRAGELEFAFMDYKRAYDATALNVAGLEQQIARLKARVAELEDMIAPEPVVVDASVGVPCECKEHPDGCSIVDHGGKSVESPVPLQAPAEDIPAPAVDAPVPEPSAT